MGRLSQLLLLQFLRTCLAVELLLDADLMVSIGFCVSLPPRLSWASSILIGLGRGHANFSGMAKVWVDWKESYRVEQSSSSSLKFVGVGKGKKKDSGKLWWDCKSSKSIVFELALLLRSLKLEFGSVARVRGSSEARRGCTPPDRRVVTEGLLVLCVVFAVKLSRAKPFLVGDFKLFSTEYSFSFAFSANELQLISVPTALSIKIGRSAGYNGGVHPHCRVSGP